MPSKTIEARNHLPKFPELGQFQNAIQYARFELVRAAQEKFPDSSALELEKGLDPSLHNFYAAGMSEA